MNTYDIKLPTLPEWLQEQIPSNTEYPVSTIITAMEQYALVAIKADRKRIVKSLRDREENASGKANISTYSYLYYVGKADAYDIAEQIVKGEL